MSDPILVTLLSQSGFEENESKVYLALLELGSAGAAEIAERAGLKRALCYHHLSGLMEKGYVSELPNKKIRRFISAEPTKIVQHFKILTENLQFYLPILRALENRGRSKPRIEIFEGIEPITKVYRDFERGKKAFYVSSVKRLNDFFPHEVSGWLDRSGTTKTITKNFLADAPADRAWFNGLPKKTNHQVKFLPKDIELEMDFAIVDDVVAITSFDPLFIVLIHSPAMARSAAAMFEAVWVAKTK